MSTYGTNSEVGLGVAGIIVGLSGSGIDTSSDSGVLLEVFFCLLCNTSLGREREGRSKNGCRNDTFLHGRVLFVIVIHF